MWRYGVWFALLAAAGCQFMPRNAAAPNPDCAAADGCAPAAPPCAPKPQVEVRPCEEVHVTAPRQKVIVPRRPAPAAETVAVEQHQALQTRQVILVPQQVLVPFIQTTTTGPVRVAGLQETQITNLTTLTTATAPAGATVQAAAPPAAAQSLADCQAQLRQCEERLKQMTAITESLAAQMQQLKAGANWGPAK